MEIGEDPTELPRFSAAMKSQMDATPRGGATNGRGMSSPQVANPQRSSMEPKTPALPPPGSHRSSGSGDADAATIGCPSAAHRWLPRVPAGAAALLRDFDRSEWGLSEELAPVSRQLADQFANEEVLPLESGGSMQVDDDAFINAHRAENDLGDLGSGKERGGVSPHAEFDWNDLPSLPERPVDDHWSPGTLVRWRSAEVAPFGEQVYGLVTREWPGALKEQRDRDAWRQGKLCIHEGWEAVWADPKDLIRYSQDTVVPRALTHYTASPSPQPILEATPTSRLGWITSQGLLDADCVELPIRRSSIPHLIGVRGQRIRMLEERLGVILGVLDLGEEGALVSVLGPLDRLPVARRVVELVSKGVRTLLERWDWDPSSG